MTKWLLVSGTLILLLASWYAATGPRLSQLERVVRDFESGKLQPDDDGRVGPALFEELEDGRKVLLFGTRVEEELVLEGWLWCSGEIRAEDYGTEIGPDREIQHTLDVCGTNRLAVRESGRPHWYRVVRLEGE